MINPKELKTNLMYLFVREDSKDVLPGHGIITDSPIYFDAKEVEKNKAYIASILEELGIDNETSISLSRLAQTKDGLVWNELKTFEDFQALELLLASADACHYIINDQNALQRNLSGIEASNIILISSFAKYIRPFEKWLKLFKKEILSKMSYITNQEDIKNNLNQAAETTILHK